MKAVLGEMASHREREAGAASEIVEHSLKTLWVANTLGRNGAHSPQRRAAHIEGGRKWGIMIGASVLQFSIHSPSSMCLQCTVGFTHTHTHLLLRNRDTRDPRHVQLLLPRQNVLTRFFLYSKTYTNHT